MSDIQVEIICSAAVRMCFVICIARVIVAWCMANAVGGGK